MRKHSLFFFLLAISVILILPTISVSAAGDQFRRWLSPKSYSCTDMGGGVIQVLINNQDVEFHSLPSNAEFLLNYIDNGVPVTDGPYGVEQTSGTKAYGALAENFAAYPLTFEFRIDTLIGSTVVYQSSIIVSCSGDASGVAAIVNSDTGPAPDQFRRWLDNGKVFTCTDMGGGTIEVKLSNQDVEFNNLPADAEFMINYIDNGVTTTDGPYVVEQTSGTKAYGALAENFAAYPLTFVFRLDTIINGVLVYQSSLSVACSADGTFPVTPVNISYGGSGGGTAAFGGCPVQIPAGSVQGRIPATVNALFEPRSDAGSNVVLPAGSSWWIIDVQGSFYKLWIACQASPVWVAAEAVTPNYDPSWGGAALPNTGA